MRKYFLILMLMFLGISVFNGKAQNVMNDTKATRSDIFMFEKDIEWESAGDGVTRQIVGYDGQVMMVKVKFEKGGIGTAHTHYHTQVTYVASGKFEFTIGKEKKIVKTGDALYIAPDVMHGCICLEEGLLIDCFSPMRADFIGKK